MRHLLKILNNFFEPYEIIYYIENFRLNYVF